MSINVIPRINCQVNFMLCWQKFIDVNLIRDMLSGLGTMRYYSTYQNEMFEDGDTDQLGGLLDHQFTFAMVLFNYPVSTERNVIDS